MCDKGRLSDFWRLLWCATSVRTSNTLFVCACLSVKHVTVSTECVIKVQRVTDSVFVSRRTPGNAVTKVRPWQVKSECPAVICSWAQVDFLPHVGCLVVAHSEILFSLLSAVSTRCSNCSPYSYCKGTGDTAACECLPGYRKSPQGKCASKHTAQQSSQISVFIL